MKRVQVGELTGAFGIQGWVKVRSYTEPRESILNYSPWELELRGERWQVEVVAGRRHGKTVVAALGGVATREEAQALRGAKISIARAQLPELSPGEFYWVDLIGCKVYDLEDRELGQVVELMETGANDVLVVRDRQAKEVLIPWVQGQVIRELKLEEGIIRVDWNPNY